MSNKTILIVEDDAILAMTLRGKISMLGYAVVGPFSSGEEAIAFLSGKQVDLVLTDIELAGDMNGITTAEILGRTLDIPVVFLTGFSQKPLLEQAKSVSPYGYLIKPVSDQALAATLEMSLHRHKVDLELKESRHALAKSEEKFRSLSESSRDYIMRYDRACRHTYMNPAGLAVTGITAADIIGKTHLESGFPEDQSRFWEEKITHVFETAEPFQTEFSWESALGLVYLDWRLTPEFDTEGRVHSVLGVSRDITDRKLAEEKLKENLQRYELVLEGSSGCIWDWNVATKTVQFSSRWKELRGLLDEDIGDSVTIWSDGIHPDDKQSVMDKVEAHFAGKTASFDAEYRVRCKDRSWKWVHDRGKVMRDSTGKVIRMAVSEFDITDRKQAELNYHALFNEMLDGFALHEIIVDDIGIPINYRFLAVNSAFERMTGLKAADIIGHTVLDIMPDTEMCWIETYGRVALTGEPVHFEDYATALRKYFEITAYRPAPGQFACVVSDVTEKKQVDEEKKKLQVQLQQAQKMEAIGTLAGGIAHDFNNILGAILGYSEMVQEDIPAGSRSRGDIDQVVKASHRAKELVKQILNFSRQAATEQIPLHPALIIQEVVKMLRSSLPSTIALQQDVDPDVGLILADPTQVHQVLVNLCTNAFHAMEETGGILTLSLKRKTLSKEELAGEPQVQPGDFVQLSISDTGSGIAPDIQAKMFDPFFTTKEVGKGTGMGLAIIHGIAKNYKGFVTYNSQPGEGTVFHVYLPVIADPVLLEIEPVPFDLPLLGNERILLIDDEEILADVGKAMLERLGYRVTVRRNSIEALNTFQNQPDQFDLVITDQTMPGMTGSDLARRMLQIRPGVPIILCTGYSSLMSEEKALSLGIKGFAFKPLAKNDIAALIRKVLSDGTSLK